MIGHVLATWAEEAIFAEVLQRGLFEIEIGSGDEDMEVASFFSPVQRDIRVDRLTPENTFDEGRRWGVRTTSAVIGVDSRGSLVILDINVSCQRNSFAGDTYKC